MASRDKYGAALLTDIGYIKIECNTRSEANRIRHVVAKWYRKGGVRDWKTVEALGKLALERPGIPAEYIITEYIKSKEL